jgi:hypothetical protein
VASVRHHVLAQSQLRLPEALARRPICALSVLANRWLEAPATVEEAVQALASPADLDPELLQRALHNLGGAITEAEEAAA